MWMSQESPTEGNNGVMPVSTPCFSPYAMEAIENGLSHGTISNSYQIDRNACLRAIHNCMSEPSVIARLTSSTTVTLISPTRHARVARLTFDREYRFKWLGWKIQNTVDVKMSCVTIENNSWTWYVEPRNHRNYYWPPEALRYLARNYPKISRDHPFFLAICAISLHLGTTKLGLHKPSELCYVSDQMVIH